MVYKKTRLERGPRKTKILREPKPVKPLKLPNGSFTIEEMLFPFRDIQFNNHYNNPTNFKFRETATITFTVSPREFYSQLEEKLMSFFRTILKIKCGGYNFEGCLTEWKGKSIGWNKIFIELEIDILGGNV